MRKNHSSGSPWEDVVGYSRVVSVDDSAWVAGTTATVDGRVAGRGDPYEQARIAFGIAIDALREVGFDARDVVRTRMFVVHIGHFDAIGRAHHEIFDAVRPVSTMVEVSRLALPEHLVEIELDAQRSRDGRGTLGT